MKKSQFTEEQILGVLKQVEGGRTIMPSARTARSGISRRSISRSGFGSGTCSQPERHNVRGQVTLASVAKASTRGLK